MRNGGPGAGGHSAEATPTQYSFSPRSSVLRAVSPTVAGPNSSAPFTPYYTHSVQFPYIRDNTGYTSISRNASLFLLPLVG